MKCWAYARRNAEDLISRGLAELKAVGDIIPMSFGTQKMLDAYEREKISFRAAGSSSRNAADEENAQCGSRISVSEAARRLRVTAKTVAYMVQHGVLCGLAASGRYRRGTTVVAANSLTQFQESFISLGELAAVTQRPQGALSMKLRNGGVALLAMPHDLSRVHWREDVSVVAFREE
ncbi:hypothetical protein [Paracoccus sp. R86501]|uniref:hypothetical protein n=1 Tax=Paracoccus sp. R86501 TaxID=3101711 RepID=UPI003670F636